MSREQELIQESIDDINNGHLNDFKHRVKNKIEDIVTIQKSIFTYQERIVKAEERLEEIKKEINELKLKEKVSL